MILRAVGEAAFSRVGTILLLNRLGGVVLEKLPVQGIGTVSNVSERLENMERKTAPTEVDRLAAVGFGGS